MLNNNEKNLLSFLKYAPIVFIILLSIIIASSLIIENNKKLEKDIINLENNYIESQKNIVKKEVERIYNYVLYEKANSEINLKNQLKQRTYEAHAIAHNIYNENQEKSQEEILKLIKDALRDIRFFDGRGYYFIHNIKGYNLLYPLDKSLENKDYSQLTDINSYKFVQTIMNTIKNKTEKIGRASCRERVCMFV